MLTRRPQPPREQADHNRGAVGHGQQPQQMADDGARRLGIGRQRVRAIELERPHLAVGEQNPYDAIGLPSLANLVAGAGPSALARTRTADDRRQTPPTMTNGGREAVGLVGLGHGIVRLSQTEGRP